jgi:hypothetical protein
MLLRADARLRAWLFLRRLVKSRAALWRHRAGAMKE